MNNKLIINGMHCDACIKLITMNLEDARLDKYIKTLTLGENNIGVLQLQNVFEQDVVNIIAVIDGIDLYSVQKN